MSKVSKSQSISRSIFSLLSTKTTQAIAPILLSLSFWGAIELQPQSVKAETPKDTPPELKNIISKIDEAANRKDIQGIMQILSPNFTNSDGLDRQNLEKGLSQFWQRYPNLKYTTQIQSWQKDNQGLVAETITNITGEKKDDKSFNIKSTIRSRQRFENQQLVQQEILAERTQITSGKKPPTVEIKLPESVSSGENYNFDVIVKEPLGNDLLIGNAIEEPVKTNSYLNPTSLQLQPLNAGGIFKMGQPLKGVKSQWLSAVIVRDGGLTMITQRLRIVDVK